MVLMFEIAGPFRAKPTIERYGPLIRVIWGWFSLASISAGFNDVCEAFRMDERERWTSVLAEKWHDEGFASGETLQEYLGMSREEYFAWIKGA